MMFLRFLSSLLLLLSVVGNAFADTNKPNILFVFMDDQQADTISRLGNTHLHTPNLDQLTKVGLTFKNMYMQGGFNAATCIPSRAMLLSGRSLFQVDEKLLNHSTWPAAFAKSGYSTFITGKWHNGEAGLQRSFQNGQAIFTGGMTNPLKAKLTNLEGNKLSKPILSEKHACEMFADQAIAFLQQEHRDPFFCYVAFDGPHDPHIVPENYQTNYDPNQIPIPNNFLSQHPFQNGELTIRDELLLPWPRQPAQIQTMLAEYYRYISYLDSQIGRIIACLNASKYAKNTIIVFTADSGVARGQHGLIGKQNLYEHSIRVPFVLSGPGVPKDQKTDAKCYLFDVLPTLAEMCHVPVSQEDVKAHGKSFLKCVQQTEKSHRSSLVFAYKNSQRALRKDHLKLIRYPDIHKTQLFDLQNDPLEIQDLASSPKYKSIVETLSKQLEEELRAAGDKIPLTNPNPIRAEWTPPRTKEKSK